MWTSPRLLPYRLRPFEVHARRCEGVLERLQDGRPDRLRRLLRREGGRDEVANGFADDPLDGVQAVVAVDNVRREDVISRVSKLLSCFGI
jgi:hypothetical protein